ncbi:YueI family protein [Evansella sp. AB-rgal1]|uniref:YueI family protein n=1 Tax=Evansella sp. AB-rgal1 TaxID=3242696 RepID=UPI00359EDB16
MSQKKLEEVLQRGIYGTPEILPEERKLFLGTISERIYLALTNSQVIKRGLYEEAAQLMKEYKSNIHLFVNGYLNYPTYSNYVQLANQNSVPFTIVSDGHETPIGIVLASTKALDTPKEFFIKDQSYFNDIPND